MKLIIGLGNPEERYKYTRHNVGFRVLTTYADRQGISYQLKERFKACVAEYTHDGEKVILVKPTTYYNSVGEAARLLADFYKVEAADILVVHDELALPFGTIRTRIGGSDAGNNGIKSMNQYVGMETARIRIGVYNELRDRINDADFVLSQFTKEEQESMETQLLAKATELINSFVAGTFEMTTHS